MTRSGRRLARRTPPDRAREEFERFVASSAADLLRLAYLVVWDLTAAEDLVQECYVRVARKWTRISKMERPDAYTRRVLVHLAIDDSRRQRRRRGELDRRALGEADQPDRVVETELGLVDLHHDLVDVLGRLAPRQRAVLVLRFFADMTEEQVAEALGCSVGTVKSTASRALARLREHYDLLPRADLTGNGHFDAETHSNGHHSPTTKASNDARTRT